MVVEHRWSRVPYQQHVRVAAATTHVKDWYLNNSPAPLQAIPASPVPG
jgi:hypothetical protein